MSEAMTIETIIDLFADEAAEYGEPRPEALERARHALAVHDAGVRRAAVEKVLALHTPVSYKPSEHYMHGSKRKTTVCECCTGLLEDADGEGGYGAPMYQEFPCPTVQAIQEALGGE